MECKQCGFNFSDQANFCPGCGTKVDGKESCSGSCAGSCKDGTVKWLKIVSILILAGLVGMILMLLFSWKILNFHLESKSESMPKTNEVFDSTPLKASIEGLMGLINRNDLKTAYANTAEDFRKTTSKEDFEKFVRENPAFLNFKSVVLEKLTFDNNMAILIGKLIADDGKIYPVQYNLLQENGEWKIVHVQIMKMNGQDFADLSGGA